MYSHAYADRRLAALRPSLALRLKEDKIIRSARSFQFERHSILEVSRAIGALNYLVLDSGQLRRQYEPPEKLFIENERALCMCDFRYWLSRYAFIEDPDGRLVHFRPNRAQRILLSLWAELESDGKPIETINLKARQLGVSTLWELLIAHYVQFYPRINAVIASSDPERSAKLATKLDICWDNQPWWIVPKLTQAREGAIYRFGAMNSEVSVQHGSQKSAGIARGATVTAAHLTELPDFLDPARSVDAALLRAIHPSPWTRLGLEGTAARREDWWHHTWRDAKEGWSSGRSRLCPVFLPWFADEEFCGATPAWFRSHPVPTQWEPAGLTLRHAERARASVRSSRALREALGEDWSLSREMAWYWETSREEYARKGELHLWYSEMPADDLEAFQSAGSTIFSTQLIAEVRETLPVPRGVYGLEGPPDEIPARLQIDPRDIDTSQEPIEITANWNFARKHSYRLVPLRHSSWDSSADPTGKIIIWEYPRDGFEYGLGVDTSDGIGADSSVIEVIRKGDTVNNDGQAAEFASAHVSATDLWPFVLAMGTLYSTRRRGRLEQALLVIDVSRNGETTQLELKKRGWANFHRWVRYDRHHLKISASNRDGWANNQRTRDLMLEKFIQYSRDGSLEVRSPWLLDEMSTFEFNGTRIEAVSGAHDDRIIAAGMVLFSMHILEVRDVVDSLAAQRQQSGARSHAAYHPGKQGSSNVEEFLRGFHYEG